MHKAKKLVSIAAVILGVLLLIYKVTVDSEPGAIPLLLIITGSIFYFIEKNKSRAGAGNSGR